MKWHEFMLVGMCIWLTMSAYGQDLPLNQDPAVLELSDEEANALTEEWKERQLSLPGSFNLNDTFHIAILVDVGWIDTAQQHALLNYIAKYGPMLSMYELIVIKGFSYQWLTTNPVRMKCEPVSKTRRGSLQAKLDQETRMMYQEGMLKTKAVSRFRVDADKNIQASLVLEKDRGESFLRQAGGSGPEHFSGFIAYRGKGILKQLVLGDFRVDGGYGLNFGKAYSSFDPRFPGGESFSPWKIRPKATSMESYASSGLAMTLLMNKITINVASSSNTIDGTLVSENGGWRIGSASYGDHSSFSSQLKRDAISIQRNLLLMGWDGKWFRSAISYQQSSLRDAFASITDSINAYQICHNQILGISWQANIPDLSFELEGCTDRRSYGIVAGAIWLPSHWISLRTQVSFQDGGWPLPSTHFGMGQWEGTQRLSHYLGVHASLGGAWMVAAGQRYSKNQILRYGMPVEEFDLRYWLKLMKNSHWGNWVVSASQRLSGPDKHTEDLAAYELRRAWRMQWNHALMNNRRMHLGIQLANAGNGIRQESWGLSTQAGMTGTLPGSHSTRFFVDFCFHEVEDAEARLTAFLHDPAGGVRMSGLYHKGLRLNSGLEWKKREGLNIWSGVVCERVLQDLKEDTYKLELVLRFSLATHLQTHPEF